MLVYYRNVFTVFLWRGGGEDNGQTVTIDWVCCVVILQGLLCRKVTTALSWPYISRMMEQQLTMWMSVAAMTFAVFSELLCFISETLLDQLDHQRPQLSRLFPKRASEHWVPETNHGYSINGDKISATDENLQEMKHQGKNCLTTCKNKSRIHPILPCLGIKIATDHHLASTWDRWQGGRKWRWWKTHELRNTEAGKLLYNILAIGPKCYPGNKSILRGSNHILKQVSHPSLGKWAHFV